nr:MAG TPA: protein of unknown function (DUF5318) [Caudoviricetes sp.]
MHPTPTLESMITALCDGTPRIRKLDDGTPTVIQEMPLLDQLRIAVTDRNGTGRSGKNKNTGAICNLDAIELEHDIRARTTQHTTTPNPSLKQAVREWAIAENRTVATIYAADWTRRIRTLNHTTVHLHNTPCPRCKKATHTRKLDDGTTKVDDALAIIVRPEEQPSTRVMTCCGACGWTETGYEAIKRLARLQAGESLVK